MRRVLLLLLPLAACASHPPAAAPATAAEQAPTPAAVASPRDVTSLGGASVVTHPDVAPVAWLAGHWTSADGGTHEHWTAAGDALFGVGMTTRAGRTVEWEVLIISRQGNALALDARPLGAPVVRFGQAAGEPDAATFSNPAHDFPQHVRYARADDRATRRVVARVWSAARALDFAYQAAPVASAPELEDADRRFAEDVGRRGLTAWVEAFHAHGAMGAGPERIEGHAAIRAAMQELLADPARRLEWTPIASGLSAAGDLGFTVGRFRRLRSGAELARGAYVTIWQKDSAGRWKVLYDVGDPEGPTP